MTKVIAAQSKFCSSFFSKAAATAEQSKVWHNIRTHQGIASHPDMQLQVAACGQRIAMPAVATAPTDTPAQALQSKNHKQKPNFLVLTALHKLLRAPVPI